MSGKFYPFVDPYNRHLHRDSKRGQTASPEDQDVEHNERADTEAENKR